VDDLRTWATGERYLPTAENPRENHLMRARRIEVSHPAPLLQYLSLLDTPGVGGLDPAHATVALAAVEQATASRPAARPHDTTVLLPALHRAIGTCVNDVDSDGGNGSVDARSVTNVVPGLDPTAGSGECDTAQSTPGTTVTAHLPGPIVGQDPTVTLPGEVPCAPAPSNPLVSCDSPQQGASQ
jgi:hypothetical protein